MTTGPIVGRVGIPLWLFLVLFVVALAAGAVMKVSEAASRRRARAVDTYTSTVEVPEILERIVHDVEARTTAPSGERDLYLKERSDSTLIFAYGNTEADSWRAAVEAKPASAGSWVTFRVDRWKDDDGAVAHERPMSRLRVQVRSTCVATAAGAASRTRGPQTHIAAPAVERSDPTTSPAGTADSTPEGGSPLVEQARVRATPVADPTAQWCPQCGGALEPGDAFCVTCGERIPGTESGGPTVQVPARQPAATIARSLLVTGHHSPQGGDCPMCRLSLAPAAQSCPRCGHQIPSLAPDSPTKGT